MTIFRIAKDTARPCIGPILENGATSFNYGAAYEPRPDLSTVLSLERVVRTHGFWIPIAPAPKPRYQHYPKRDEMQYAIPRNAKGANVAAATATRHRLSFHTQ